MGKKSVKTNKSAYQLSRERAGLTREAASELLGFISSDRIEKLENGTLQPHPEELLAMEQAYKDPELCNRYCSKECPIGRKYVPEVKVKALSQIVLEMLASLNSLESEKNRLIEMTVDGHITEDEMTDFGRIREKLEDIELAIRSLRMWVENALMTGTIEVQ